jgi:ferredoxin
MDQYLRGEPVVGEAQSAAVVFRPVDDAERALIFRGIEMAARVPMPEIEMERRLAGFDEVATGLTGTDAGREARRCLTCGCRKSDCCRVRTLATEYGADAGRFAGARRRFSQDTSHPDIVYEPGKCILCDACVRIAAAAGEALGLTAIGRGFDVTVAAPFGQPLSEALRMVALRCAEACPSGALALRSAGSPKLRPQAAFCGLSEPSTARSGRRSIMRPPQDCLKLPLSKLMTLLVDEDTPRRPDYISPDVTRSDVAPRTPIAGHP